MIFNRPAGDSKVLDNTRFLTTTAEFDPKFSPQGRTTPDPNFWWNPPSGNNWVGDSGGGEQQLDFDQLRQHTGSVQRPTGYSRGGSVDPEGVPKFGHGRLEKDWGETDDLTKNIPDLELSQKDFQDLTDAKVREPNDHGYAEGGMVEEEMPMDDGGMANINTVGVGGGFAPEAALQTGYAPSPGMAPMGAPTGMGGPMEQGMPEEEPAPQEPKEPRQPKPKRVKRVRGGRKGGGRRKRRTGYARGGEVEKEELDDFSRLVHDVDDYHRLHPAGEHAGLGYAYGGEVEDDYSYSNGGGSSDGAVNYTSGGQDEEFERRRQEEEQAREREQQRATEEQSIPENARYTQGQQDFGEQLGGSLVNKPQTGYPPLQDDSYDPMGMVKQVLNSTREMFGLGGGEQQAGYQSAEAVAERNRNAPAPYVPDASMPTGGGLGRGAPTGAEEPALRPQSALASDEPQQPRPLIEPAGGRTALSGGIGLPPEPAGGHTAFNPRTPPANEGTVSPDTSPVPPDAGIGDLARRAALKAQSDFERGISTAHDQVVERVRPGGGIEQGVQGRHEAIVDYARPGGGLEQGVQGRHEAISGAVSDALAPVRGALTGYLGGANQAGPEQGPRQPQGPDLDGYMRAANAPDPTVLDQRLQQIAQANPGASEEAINRKAVLDPMQMGDRQTAMENLAGLRARYNSANTLVQGAAGSGDLETATKLATWAHNHVPDNRNITYQPDSYGNVTATVSNADGTGQPTNYNLTADQFRNFMVSQGTDFDHMIETGADKLLQIASRPGGAPATASGGATPEATGAGGDQTAIPATAAPTAGQLPTDTAAAPTAVPPTLGDQRSAAAGAMAGAGADAAVNGPPPAAVAGAIAGAGADAARPAPGRVDTQGRPLGPGVGQPVPAAAQAEPPQRYDTQGRPIGGVNGRFNTNEVPRSQAPQAPQQQPIPYSAANAAARNKGLPPPNPGQEYQFVYSGVSPGGNRIEPGLRLVPTENYRPKPSPGRTVELTPQDQAKFYGQQGGANSQFGLGGQQPRGAEDTEFSDRRRGGGAPSGGGGKAPKGGGGGQQSAPSSGVVPTIPDSTSPAAGYEPPSGPGALVGVPTDLGSPLVQKELDAAARNNANVPLPPVANNPQLLQFLPEGYLQTTEGRAAFDRIARDPNYRVSPDSAGMRDFAGRLMSIANPVYGGSDPRRGDVYTNPPYAGSTVGPDGRVIEMKPGQYYQNGQPVAAPPRGQTDQDRARAGEDAANRVRQGTLAPGQRDQYGNVGGQQGRQEQPYDPLGRVGQFAPSPPKTNPAYAEEPFAGGAGGRNVAPSLPAGTGIPPVSPEQQAQAQPPRGNGMGSWTRPGTPEGDRAVMGPDGKPTTQGQLDDALRAKIGSNRGPVTPEENAARQRENIEARGNQQAQQAQQATQQPGQQQPQPTQVRPAQVRELLPPIRQEIRDRKGNVTGYREIANPNNAAINASNAAERHREIAERQQANHADTVRRQQESAIQAVERDLGVDGRAQRTSINAKLGRGEELTPADKQFVKDFDARVYRKFGIDPNMQEQKPKEEPGIFQRMFGGIFGGGGNQQPQPPTQQQQQQPSGGSQTTKVLNGTTYVWDGRGWKSQ